MKRIIRLTEQDLNRIVRRVISEQKESPFQTMMKNQVAYGIKQDKIAAANNTGTGAAAFQLIKKGIELVGRTDEASIGKGVFMLKTKADYDACLRLTNKSAGYPTIMKYIATDMDYDFDTQSAGDTNNGQGVSFFDSNPILRSWSNHLRKFNDNEIPA